MFWLCKELWLVSFLKPICPFTRQCINKASSTVPQLCFIDRCIDDVVFNSYRRRSDFLASKLDVTNREFYFNISSGSGSFLTSGPGRIYSMDHHTISSICSHVRRLFQLFRCQQNLLHASTLWRIWRIRRISGEILIFTRSLPHEPCASRKSETSRVY